MEMIGCTSHLGTLMRHIKESFETTSRLAILEPLSFEHSHIRPLDDAARKRAADNILLAYHLAWSFARHHARDMPIDELKAEALFGLTYAASLFDEEYEIPFSAYAFMVIRHRLTAAVRNWRRAKRAVQYLGSLDGFIRETEVIPKPVLAEGLEAHEMCEQVRRVIPPRWYEIIYQYHAEGQTLDAIGQRLGVTRQRVRQLLVQASKRVRHHFPEWTCF